MELEFLSWFIYYEIVALHGYFSFPIHKYSTFRKELQIWHCIKLHICYSRFTLNLIWICVYSLSPSSCVSMFYPISYVSPSRSSFYCDLDANWLFVGLSQGDYRLFFTELGFPSFIDLVLRSWYFDCFFCQTSIVRRTGITFVIFGLFLLTKQVFLLFVGLGLFGILDVLNYLIF